jgi:hypothetical protein
MKSVRRHNTCSDAATRRKRNTHHLSAAVCDRYGHSENLGMSRRLDWCVYTLTVQCLYQPGCPAFVQSGYDTVTIPGQNHDMRTWRFQAQYLYQQPVVRIVALL